MVGRCWHRPYLTLAVTLLLAAGLFTVQIRRPKLYKAEVGLLIIEGAFAADGRPRPRGELRSFIEAAVLAAPRLVSGGHRGIVR